jgi:hypothetical protein
VSNEEALVHAEIILSQAIQKMLASLWGCGLSCIHPQARCVRNLSNRNIAQISLQIKPVYNYCNVTFVTDKTH